MEDLSLYYNDAMKIIKEKGIEVDDGYSVSKGTNLNSNISELEDGVVVIVNDKKSTILSEISYYYNYKNKVLYKYENEKFERI
ncbi:hypothetical protein [Clostridium baratii]|uniref:hypothetical protein n=1 Tax=Clostridium baratii TaxID=1561 RepID=UPI0006BA76F6|nr:hypothetical protein [Clostridium baratii]